MQQQQQQPQQHSGPNMKPDIYMTNKSSDIYSMSPASSASPGSMMNPNPAQAQMQQHHQLNSKPYQYANMSQPGHHMPHQQPPQQQIQQQLPPTNPHQYTDYYANGPPAPPTMPAQAPHMAYSMAPHQQQHHHQNYMNYPGNPSMAKYSAQNPHAPPPVPNHQAPPAPPLSQPHAGVINRQMSMPPGSTLPQGPLHPPQAPTQSSDQFNLGDTQQTSLSDPFLLDDVLDINFEAAPTSSTAAASSLLTTTASAAILSASPAIIDDEAFLGFPAPYSSQNSAPNNAAPGYFQPQAQPQYAHYNSNQNQHQNQSQQQHHMYYNQQAPNYHQSSNFMATNSYANANQGFDLIGAEDSKGGLLQQLLLD